MKKIFSIGIWIFVVIMFVLNIYEVGVVSASIKLAVIMGIGITAIVLTNKFKWKFVRLLQIVGFGGFFIAVLFGSILEVFQISLLAYSVMVIFTSIMVKQFLPKRKLKTRSLEERVKRDLKITGITVKKRFPKVFNRIGGLVIPALPFVSFINKNWKKKLNKEAIIHENVHLYYLQNGWILAVMIISIIILLPLSYLFPFVNNHTELFSFILVVFVLVHFEYITFNKTNRIADALGIKTRKWNRKLALTYLIIYGIQIGIIFFIIQGIKFIVGLVRGLG